MSNQDDQSPAADPDEIRRLIDSAGADVECSADSGRRNRARFRAGMQLDVTTNADDDTRTWPVTMHDISDRGFAFWSKRLLRKDTCIFVREFSADNSSPWLAARVTHCTVGIRGYLIGAEFNVTAVSSPTPPD